MRDYLAGYLNDLALLKVLAEGTPMLRAARNLYDHFMKQPGLNNEDIADFTRKLLALCERATQVGVWKPIPGDPYRSRWYEISNADRIELLVEWWRLSGEDGFLDAAQMIANKGGAAFSAWNDGRKLPEVLASLRTTIDRDVPIPSTLIDAVELGLSEMIRSGLDPDDIERVLSSVEAQGAGLPPGVIVEIEEAIHRMIGELPDNLDHVDSESTLDDWGTTIAKLGERVQADLNAMNRATQAIEAHKERLREAEYKGNEVSFTGSSERDQEVFDDAALANLFAPLAVQQDYVRYSGEPRLSEQSEP